RHVRCSRHGMRYGTVLGAVLVTSLSGGGVWAQSAEPAEAASDDTAATAAREAAPAEAAVEEAPASVPLMGVGLGLTFTGVATLVGGSILLTKGVTRS